MTNLQIKKTIEEATKRVDYFRLEVILWHGETSNIQNAIYNEVLIFDEDNNLVESDDTYFGSELEDTEDNIEILKKEQKKTYNYLIKHFENVAIIECNV